jgi:hypothetical protein
MPQRVTNVRLETVGGKTTDYGRELFLARQREMRERILRTSPRYRDITERVYHSPVVLGDTTNNGRSAGKRKGNTMPAKIDTTVVVSRRAVAGKRGRKSAFNSADFKCDVDGMLDVTDEMASGIESYVANSDDATPFTLDDLFVGENSTANKYRGVRFGALKRAATVANGEGSKYSLEIGAVPVLDEDGVAIPELDEDGEETGEIVTADRWLLVRTK